MTNFSLNFSIPWLLLLLIPAIVLTLIPYFRLNKKYRKTRNRIISIILHVLIMTMCISVLAGMTFTYNIPNDDNEIILLVDASFSSSDQSTLKTRYVNEVIDQNDSTCRIGIVAFGYNQYIVSDLTFNGDIVKSDYANFIGYEEAALIEGRLEDRLIDDTATDLASAIDYVVFKSNNQLGMFKNRQSAKIVVISDCIQTDNNALTTIRKAGDVGVRVDIASYKSYYTNEVEIVDVELPQDKIVLEKQQIFNLTIRNNIPSDYDDSAKRAYIILEDYKESGAVDVQGDTQDNGREYFDLYFGEEQIIPFKYSGFRELGEHVLKFTLVCDVDGISANNVFYSYVNIQKFNQILILTGYEGEGDEIKDILTTSTNEVDSNGNHRYTDEDILVVNINPQIATEDDFSKVPTTVDELRMYDEVILVNVANSDLVSEKMPKNASGVSIFPNLLDEYVKTYGGGLFVVGGNEYSDGKLTAHAFNITDLKTGNATTFRSMLPVEPYNYTPPVAAVVLIDRSGSMASATPTGKSYLDYAKEGAIECLELMSQRDYLAVLSLEKSVTMESGLTSLRNKNKLRSSIEGLIAGGGTYFYEAVYKSGELLAKEISWDDVAKKHVILISDGAYQDNIDATSSAIKTFFTDYGVRFSFIHTADANSSVLSSVFSADNSGGTYISISSGNAANIKSQLKSLLTTESIGEYTNIPFEPKALASQYNSYVFDGITVDEETKVISLPEMGGFAGVNSKTTATEYLLSKYVPLYTDWKYGNGMVGAFTAPLSGSKSVVNDNWSTEFVKSANGRRIVSNIVGGLMPSDNIRPNDLSVNLITENYISKINIVTNVEKTQRIKITVYSPNSDGNVSHSEDDIFKVIWPSEEESYSRATIYLKEPRMSLEEEYKEVKAGVYYILVEKLEYGKTNINVESDEPTKVLSTASVTQAFSYSKEYSAFNDEVETFIDRALALSNGSNLDINSITDVDTIFTGFADGIEQNYNPATLFMILSIIFFLLDIAVRKFKFKWLHEIIRDRKEKKFSDAGKVKK